MQLDWSFAMRATLDFSHGRAWLQIYPLHTPPTMVHEGRSRVSAALPRRHKVLQWLCPVMAE